MDQYGQPVFDILNIDPPNTRIEYLLRGEWTPALLRGNFSADPVAQGEEIFQHGLDVEQRLQDLATNEGYTRFKTGDSVKTENETRVGTIERITNGRIYVSMQPVIPNNAPITNVHKTVDYRVSGEPIWSMYFEDGRPFPNNTDMGVSYLVKNTGAFLDKTLFLAPLPVRNPEEIANAQNWVGHMLGDPAGAGHGEIPAADAHALANAIAGIHPMEDA